MDEMFRGVCPVLNTPFRDDGEVDHDSLSNLVDYAIDARCRSLSIFAMNSEPTRLTTEEKHAVLDTFFAATRGRVHTAVGLVEDSIRSARVMAQVAAKGGVDALILFPPGRVPPAGERLAAYLKEIAASVDLPLMYQDAPRTTGVAVSTEFIVSLSKRIPNLHYVKVECPLPVLRLEALVAQTSGKLRSMSGNGGIYTIDAFRRGAWGVMPGVAVVDRFVALYECFAAGDLNGARDIFENLMPLLWFEDQSLDFFIACEKQILFERGVIASPHIRENGLTLTENDRDELNALLARLHSGADAKITEVARA